MKTYEDEEFERIERENKERSYVALKDTPSREQLMAEVTVLTELVRVLNDRVNELEREQAMREVQRLGQEIEQEPVPAKGALLPQRTWVGLTDEEILKHQDIVPNSYSLDLIEFAQAIEAKLKEKNT